MLHNYIGTEHILLGLMREERSVAAGILTEKGMRLAGTREDILALLNEKAAAGKSKETPLLSEFSRDLTEAAARGALDPLVGREDELERVIQVLCRRTRNNPVLIGEPGVGKTALVEGLATKIVQRRRAGLPGREARAGARHLADRRGHQVPRPVRGAAEDDHAGAHRDPEHRDLHRRAAHAGRRGLGRGLARRRQHPEAGALARRDPVHRRDDTLGVPQAHREGPVAGAALPGGQGGVAHRGRDGRDPARGEGALREVPQRALHRRGDRGRGLPVEPLHHRPLPARQGDRPDRRGRQPREAARDGSARAGAGALRPRARGAGSRRLRARRLLPRGGGAGRRARARASPSSGRSAARAATRSPRPTSTRWSRAGRASRSRR